MKFARTNQRIPTVRLQLSLSLLAVLALAACQTTQNTPAVEITETPPIIATPTDSVQPTATPLADPTPIPEYLIPLEQLDGLQIQFWHPWTGDISKEIDLLVDQFNQTNEWGIHVILRKSGSSMALASEVDSAAASGDDLPQVVAAPSEQLLTWLERDQLILPLDTLINDPQWGLSEQQRAEITLAFWLQDQSQDRQAGIPAQRNAQVIIYNQTWAKELGFDVPPQTAEEFRAQACAAAQVLLNDTNTSNDGMGGWIMDTQALTIYSWLSSFGTNPIIQGDPIQFSFNQPQAVQAFTFLRGMLDDGCAWNARSQTPQEYFNNRQALYYSAGLLDLPVQVRMQFQSGSQDEWIVLPFPGDPRPTLVVSGNSYGILRSTPAREAAGWLFVRWMSSPENQARLLTFYGGLPISVSAASLATSALHKIPQWASVISWIPFAQPAPQAAGWRVAQHVLEDAAWQAMQSHIPIEQIPDILAELDATISELLAREE